MNVSRPLASALAVLFLAACGSMSVVSDGADSKLMLKGGAARARHRGP